MRKPVVLTPAEFAQRAGEIIREGEGDPEVRHCEADDLMAETLTRLGYSEGVDLIFSDTRWYA